MHFPGSLDFQLLSSVIGKRNWYKSGGQEEGRSQGISLHLQPSLWSACPLTASPHPWTQRGSPALGPGLRPSPQCVLERRNPGLLHALGGCLGQTWTTGGTAVWLWEKRKQTLQRSQSRQAGSPEEVVASRQQMSGSKIEKCIKKRETEGMQTNSTTKTPVLISSERQRT